MILPYHSSFLLPDEEMEFVSMVETGMISCQRLLATGILNSANKNLYKEIIFIFFLQLKNLMYTHRLISFQEIVLKFDFFFSFALLFI